MLRQAQHDISNTNLIILPILKVIGAHKILNAYVFLRQIFH